MNEGLVADAVWPNAADITFLVLMILVVLLLLALVGPELDEGRHLSEKSRSPARRGCEHGVRKRGSGRRSSSAGGQP